MLATCCPNESARPSVTSRTFGRGLKHSEWPTRWIAGPVHVSCKEFHLTFFCVQCHPVMPSSQFGKSGAFAHCNLDCQLAKVVETCNSPCLGGNERLCSPVICALPYRFERTSRSHLSKVRGKAFATALFCRSSFQPRSNALRKIKRVRTVFLYFEAL